MSILTRTVSPNNEKPLFAPANVCSSTIAVETLYHRARTRRVGYPTLFSLSLSLN